jgi:hypothetical protein
MFAMPDHASFVGWNVALFPPDGVQSLFKAYRRQTTIGPHAMRLKQVSPTLLVIRNNSWSRDWIIPAFFLFLALLWHFLMYPLIFEADDDFVYFFTHAIIASTSDLAFGIYGFC